MTPIMPFFGTCTEKLRMYGCPHGAWRGLFRVLLIRYAGRAPRLTCRRNLDQGDQHFGAHRGGGEVTGVIPILDLTTKYLPLSKLHMNEFPNVMLKTPLSQGGGVNPSQGGGRVQLKNARASFKYLITCNILPHFSFSQGRVT